MPPILLGNSAATGTAWSLAKVSLGKKLIGLLTLPAIGLFLMFGTTLFGFAKIRQAILGEQTGDVDYLALATAQKQWRKKYALPIGIVIAAALISPFFGYSLLFRMLLASGVAMVSLVVALGKAGVVNHQAIGGGLGMGLAQLASFASIGLTSGSDIHLLNQAFVICTLNTAALILLAMLSLNSGLDKPAEQFDSRRLWWVIVCPLAFGVHLLVGGLVLAVTITLLHFA